MWSPCDTAEKNGKRNLEVIVDVKVTTEMMAQLVEVESGYNYSPNCPCKMVERWRLTF